MIPLSICSPFRLDIFVDGEYKLPVNGYYEDDQLRFNAGDFTIDPTDAVRIKSFTCFLSIVETPSVILYFT